MKSVIRQYGKMLVAGMVLCLLLGVMQSMDFLRITGKGMEMVLQVKTEQEDSIDAKAGCFDEAIKKEAYAVSCVEAEIYAGIPFSLETCLMDADHGKVEVTVDHMTFRKGEENVVEIAPESCLTEDGLLCLSEPGFYSLFCTADNGYRTRELQLTLCCNENYQGEEQ